MTVPLLAVHLLFSLASQQGNSCSVISKAIAIHWSEKTELRSPDCRWIIDIHPLGGGDGPAEIRISSAKSQTSHVVWKLNRDGIIHWSAGGDGFLLEDMQFSNRYRLALFDPLSESGSPAGWSEIDQRVRADVEHELRSSEKINYYFPRYVGWTKSGLVVSVGVVTVPGSSGSFTAHCFGFEIETQPLTIRAVLKEADLKKKYGASCQIWP